MDTNQRNLNAISTLSKAGGPSTRLLGLLLNVVIVIIVLLLGRSAGAVALGETRPE
ncbi:MAG: hypothetical protein JXA21_21870 [Anaerolineae bacterium]|nr:hypothetical protein [Anaerolineae bacterium]